MSASVLRRFRHPLLATVLLGVFFVPLLYVVVVRLVRRWRRPEPAPATAAE